MNKTRFLPAQAPDARRRRLCAFAYALLAPAVCLSDSFPLPPSDIDTIGEIQFTKSAQEDTLLDVARRFSLGQDEIVLANPKVDRWLPGEGAEVMLPKLFILPDAPRDGIVLNVPEMRLYFYRKHEVLTYPVSIGRMDWNTPLGTTRVVEKIKDPTWTPPASIKREHAADGDFLPNVVPAGPDNPLGRSTMRLGVSGYNIHGTNKPFGIGMRVTHGCVRLYPEDIENLFPIVPAGTVVHIVNQPVKIGRQGENFYVEVHPPLEEENMDEEQLLIKALDLIERKAGDKLPQIDVRAFKDAVKRADGVPALISKVIPVSPPVVMD